MHSKNNNKPTSYIQGLRPFSSAIPKALRKHLRKGGYNYSNIIDNWTNIVSTKISGKCYPVSVKMGKNMKDGNLVLNVIHGKELEIEYEKKNIIDKINSFFGYNCISQVTLKIAQDSVKSKKKFFSKIKNLSRIEKKMNEIKNDELKSSLNNFLKVFNEKNN